LHLLEKLNANCANRKAIAVMQNNVLNLVQQVSGDGLGELVHLILTVLSQLIERSCSAGQDVSVA
jgi:hypothetical protein